MAHPIRHFRTITKHRHAVICNCARAGILFQGLRHDLSKYSLTEFLPGARYYVGTKSPNELERRDCGYSSAWLHHKGRNRHHFEYWQDYNPVTHCESPVRMPLKYVIEMFCDRIAASKIYMQDSYSDAAPLHYFAHARVRRMIHPDTAAFLEFLLQMLAEQGEKATFSYIRAYRKTHKDYEAPKIKTDPV